MKKTNIIISIVVILAVVFVSYHVYDLTKSYHELGQESQAVKDYRKSSGERIAKLKERQAEAEQRIKDLNKKE